MLWAGAVLVLAFAARPAVQKEPPAEPPNIIYILADDLGYKELGSYGQRKIKTPRLDRMAAEGMRFTQFYSGSPVCAPSRCTFLTGKHTGRAYVRDNHELGGFRDEEEHGQLPLPPSEKTLAAWLKERGYATALVGKWGLGGPGSDGTAEPARLRSVLRLSRSEAGAQLLSDAPVAERDARPARRTSSSCLTRRYEGDPNDPKSYAKYKGADYAMDAMTREALDVRAREQGSALLPLLRADDSASGAAGAG